MLDFSSTQKNRDVIAKVLSSVYPADKPLRVLELASGSGQHAVFFADRFPRWTFQPTDLEPEHLQSIEAYRSYHGSPNLLPAIQLDASAEPWPLEGPFDAIWAINLIHISPWETTLGLFRGARRHLLEGGSVYLYGAYRRGGEHTAPSNQAFDMSLKQRNPRWGVRCLDEVEAVARSQGFQLSQVVEMPANNLSVVFEPRA